MLIFQTKRDRDHIITEEDQDRITVHSSFALQGDGEVDMSKHKLPRTTTLAPRMTSKRACPFEVYHASKLEAQTTVDERRFCLWGNVELQRIKATLRLDQLSRMSA